MSDVKNEVIEIDADVTKAVAVEVSKSFDAKFEEMTKSLEAKIAEATKVAEVVVDKGARGGAAVEGEILNEYSKMSKEEFTVKQFAAAAKGDRETLGKMNVHAMGTLETAGVINKATYLNATTAADGAVLVPNAELLGEVMDLLPTYSAIAGELRVITLTEGDSIDVATLTADVVMTEVGTEGGAKTVTKTTMATKNVSVREWAGIALLTKKLLKQSAIDVYAILRDSYARAIAKTREQLAITDATSGIINDAGVVDTVLGAGLTSYTDVTYSMIKAMPYAVPTQSANGGIYVISRLLLAHLDTLVDSTGQDIITVDGTNNAGQLAGRFKNGYRFVVAETLGTTDAVSTVYAVFGNFGQYGIVVRQGAVDTDIFDSGTVTDGGAAVHNLIQENKLAMRVETWENVGYPLPGAFNLLTTAAA